MKMQLHQIEEGETLKSIAKKYYGDAQAIVPILKANGLSDPNQPLTPGKVLVIPLIKG